MNREEIQSQKIILAFSGGPDSVFLLHHLLENGCKNIVIAHFQHHLRGKESENDAEFSEETAKNFELFFERGDWENPVQSEEKARKARYEFLELVRKKHNADWILTAHHADDVSETVLLQFLRDGNVKSLCGICEKNEEQKIFRPLLGFKKSEILAYLEEKKISFCIDSTNSENVFTRNYVRNFLLPELEQRFFGITSRLLENVKNFQEMVEILEEKKNIFFQDFPLQKGILVEKYFLQKKVVRFEILRSIWKNLNTRFFEEVEFFLKTASSGKKKKKDGITILLFSGKFFVEKED